MSPEDWARTSWDIQRAYLEGLEGDGLIQRAEEDTPVTNDDARLSNALGPAAHRKVDTGQDVIDLAAMRAELSGKK